MTMVVLMNIGNFSLCRSVVFPLIGLACTITVWILTTIHFPLRNPKLLYLDIVRNICFTLTAGHHLAHIITYLIPEKNRGQATSSILEPGAIESDRNIVRSALFKTSRMMQNALEIATHDDDQDNVIDTYYAQGLYLFSKLPDKFEKVGGIVWAMKNYLGDNTLSRHEGIRVSAKSRANVFTLMAISIYILIFGIRFSILIMDKGMEKGLDAFIHNSLDSLGKTFFSTTNNTSFVAETSAVALTAITAGFIEETVKEEGIQCALTDFSDFFSPEDSTFAQNFIDRRCNGKCSLLDEEFLCAMTEGLNSFVPLGNVEIEQQLLLQAAGFNISAIENAASKVFEETIDKGLENVKPTHRYM